jgi:hypothetical protein
MPYAPYEAPEPFGPLQVDSYVPEGYGSETDELLKALAEERKWSMLAAIGSGMVASPTLIGQGMGQGVSDAVGVGADYRDRITKLRESRQKSRFDMESKGTYDAYLKRQAEVSGRESNRKDWEANKPEGPSGTDFQARRANLAKWAEANIEDPTERANFMAAVDAGDDNAVETAMRKYGVEGTPEGLDSYEMARLRRDYDKFITDEARKRMDADKPKSLWDRKEAEKSGKMPGNLDEYKKEVMDEYPFDGWIQDNKGVGAGRSTGEGGSQSGSDTGTLSFSDEQNTALRNHVNKVGPSQAAEDLMRDMEAAGQPITYEQAQAAVKQASTSQGPVGEAAGPVDKSGEAPVATSEAQQRILDRQAAGRAAAGSGPSRSSVYEYGKEDVGDPSVIGRAKSIFADTMESTAESYLKGQDEARRGQPQTRPEIDARNEAARLAREAGITWVQRRKAMEWLRNSGAPFEEWPQMMAEYLAELPGYRP